MLTWILPAVFEMCAAPLLKWRERWSAFAIAGIGMVVALFLSVSGGGRLQELTPARAAADSWSRLRVGMIVYTGQGGAESSVCPTLATLLTHADNGLCRIVPPATPAIVDAIIPCKETDSDWGYESPHVELHAADNSWNGFTDAGSLQPNVPAGTLLALRRDWGVPLVIQNERGSQTIIEARRWQRFCAMIQRELHRFL